MATHPNHIVPFDRSILQSPRLLIVPHNAPVLIPQPDCRICFGEFIPPQTNPHTATASSHTDQDSTDDLCLGLGPRQLPCGHIFGHTCLVSAFQLAPLCPLCRREYVVREADMSSWSYLIREQTRLRPSNCTEILAITIRLSGILLLFPSFMVVDTGMAVAELVGNGLTWDGWVVILLSVGVGVVFQSVVQLALTCTVVPWLWLRALAPLAAIVVPRVILFVVIVCFELHFMYFKVRHWSMYRVGRGRRRLCLAYLELWNAWLRIKIFVLGSTRRYGLRG